MGTMRSATATTAGGSINGAIKGNAGALDSAFTKLFSTCDWHPEDAGLFVLWQHPWAGWCDCNAAKSCGQEKQFPQNSAITTSAAMIELEAFRILTPLYTDCGELQQGFRSVLPVFGHGAVGRPRKLADPAHSKQRTDQAPAGPVAVKGTTMD
jgi:hypothetical protein